MRRLSLLLIPLTLVVFTLLLGAAVLIGRGDATPVAVVQNSKAIPNRVDYTLIDIDRHVQIPRAINVPDALEERWSMHPPLVMQRKIREARGQFVDWIFSTVDVWNNTTTPVMFLTIRSEARLRIQDAVTRPMPDGSLHVTVYVPFTGEIWTSTSDAPEAVLLATVEPRLDFPLFWSMDGRWLSVKGYMQNRQFVIDATDGSQRAFTVPEMAVSVWSNDSRYLLTNPQPRPYLDELPVPASLIDTRDGTQSQIADMTSLTWCGGDLIALDNDFQPPKSILRINPDSLESESIFNLDKLQDFETTNALPMSGACDWFVLNGMDELRLLNIDTGEAIPLGGSILPIEVTEEALTYQVETEDAFEVRQIVFDSGAAPVTLARLPYRINNVPFSFSIHWFEDWQTGLLVEGGMLKLIDLRDSSQVPLIETESWNYYLLPED